jgi:hypothetical protein
VIVTNTKPEFILPLTPIADILMAINDIMTLKTDYFTDFEGSDVMLSCYRAVASAGTFPTTFIAPTIVTSHPSA